jgi:hypothetical protein
VFISSNSFTSFEQNQYCRPNLKLTSKSKLIGTRCRQQVPAGSKRPHPKDLATAPLDAGVKRSRNASNAHCHLSTQSFGTADYCSHSGIYGPCLVCAHRLDNNFCPLWCGPGRCGYWGWDHNARPNSCLSERGATCQRPGVGAWSGAWGTVMARQPEWHIDSQRMLLDKWKQAQASAHARPCHILRPAYATS